MVDQRGEGAPEVRGRFKHVHRGDLEGDRLELGQEVEVHEVFLDSAVGRAAEPGNQLFERCSNVPGRTTLHMVAEQHNTML